MTILLLCKMFGVPTSRLTSILAVDWLIHQVDSVCKTLTDSTAVHTFLEYGKMVKSSEEDLH